mmetsp:Transcript_699/g.1690  ORF Transcript_699/g.1690 Transcript_699/m.1690 type:complete len:346 (-) Transcript_699:355-1392(-)
MNIFTNFLWRRSNNTWVQRFQITLQVQYADVDDGTDFSGTQHRRYRAAQLILRAAAKDWREKGVGTVVQLGDLVDGKNAAAADKRAAFSKMRDELKEIEEVYHVIGNHDLYNLSKKELEETLQCPTSYFSFRPCEGWRCIIIDAYEQTVIGPDATEESKAYLSAHNPNKWWESGVNFQTGLAGAMKRFVPYNGALSKTQLGWLGNELSSAEEAKERVVIFSHIPLHPMATQPASRYMCLPWNYDEVLTVLESTNAEVAGVFTGHDHTGGFTQHQYVWNNCTRCIPHYSLIAAVEATEPTCHATLVLADDGLYIDNAHAIHPFAFSSSPPHSVSASVSTAAPQEDA